jgi:hypothetical protein
MIRLWPDSRRMRRLVTCAILWLAAIAGGAAAQTVPVRSGAHDGFDRLVIDLPARTPWQIEPRETGVSVIFDGTGLRFDLGAVFDRIGRQRLRAISAPGEGRLELEFACACEVSPFWHGGNMLVLDIADPPPAPPAPTARLRPVTAPQQGSLVSAGLAAPVTSIAGAALAERLGPRISAGPSAQAVAPSVAAQADDALREMRVALSQQLGRAASQGLVTPTVNQSTQRAPRPVDAALAPLPQATDPDPAMPPPQEAARHIAVPGLRATTSMDRDITGGAPPDLPARTCPQAAHIDVAAWGGAGPFASEVGRLNSMLFGEFDSVDEASALRLARLYIHHGFGIEARQVLGWLDARSPEVAAARELAALVETGSVPDGSRIAGALGCGEPGVLWAILAMPRLPDEAVFDHRALQRSFVALPDGVRRAVGPALVQRLTSAGHHATADALLRQMPGGDAPSDAEEGLARAALARETGKPETAQTTLREITRTNSEQTGIALAETIESALAREAPVGFDDAQLAGALAFEHRGTPLGERLTLGYLSALAASGAFDEAMTEFDRLRPSVGAAAVPRVASVLATYLVTYGDDITFLRAIIADRIAPPGTLDAPVSLAVARRLLDLGFPAQAARHVAPIQGAETGADRKARKLVRARIALAQDRPAEALRELLGLSGDEVDLLRAEAFAARGDHTGALKLFAAHDVDRRADRAALHVGQAAILAQAADPQIREIGEIMAADADIAEAGEEAGVAAHRALLERCTALRGAMQRLLAAPPPEPARQ